MITYRIRPRTFRMDEPAKLSFPAKLVLRLHFLPKQPFGGVADGGRTATRAKSATALFNANNGQHQITSSELFPPIEVIMEGADRTLSFTGSVLTAKQSVSSLEELGELVNALYYCIPPLLNVQFIDPPYVERVDGTLNELAFRWELLEWHGHFDITESERQEKRAASVLEQFFEVATVERRRVLAAVHYFHVACRLDRISSTPGEFLPEALLNYAKVLEVLFPPGGDGQTREAVRTGLRAIGYADTDIERDFIPAMALRNEIDVGHVDLSLFTLDQLKVLHEYAGAAERAFRDLLGRVLDKVQDGSFVPRVWAPSPAEPRLVALIERIRQSRATAATQ